MIPKSLYDDIKAAGCDYNHTVDPDELPPPCGEYYQKTENLTKTLNPYDLYRFVGHDFNGTKASTKSALYSGNNYARFSRRFAAAESTLAQSLNDDELTLPGYLNQDDVKEALHISSDAQPWSSCTNDPRFDYRQQEEASEWIYRVLKMQPTIRMMHYSGDTDGVVPTYGTKQWIEGLNWDVKEPFTPWKLKDEVFGNQV